MGQRIIFPAGWVSPTEMDNVGEENRAVQCNVRKNVVLRYGCIAYLHLSDWTRLQLVAHEAGESILCIRVATQIFTNYFGGTRMIGP